MKTCRWIALVLLGHVACAGERLEPGLDDSDSASASDDASDDASDVQPVAEDELAGALANVICEL